MSIEKEFGTATESPPLFNYLQELIPLEDIRDFASPKRIGSIDFVKGFAIVFIILAHSAAIWLDSENRYLYGLLFTLLDFLGPSLFVFLSSLSVIFSIKNKQNILPTKVIRMRIFSRGIIIILIATIYNVTSLAIENYAIPIPFPLNLWGWNILMFIGFSQIFSYYALKISKLYRGIIGIIIVLLSNPIRDFIFVPGLEDGNLLVIAIHYIVIGPNPMVPLLPGLAICFISTIFGEYLYEAMNKGTKDAYVGLFRIFMVWSIILIFIGIGLGFQLYTFETIPGGNRMYPEYPSIGLLDTINTKLAMPGIPEFLIRGRGPNMVYNLGAALLVISISFYMIDIKNKYGNFVKMLVYYGKVSLSLFFVHQIFLGLFSWQFGIALFLINDLSYIGLMGFLMYIWMEYANGIGSPEWLMAAMGRMGKKKRK
ncbi:MAG: heparan-alpha-glucosaminide N-acetyltransferase domain-containing protein [Candidatus Hermodarchaeota archaeon]